MLYNLRCYIFDIIRVRMVGLNKRHVQNILSIVVPSSISIISLHYSECLNYILYTPNHKIITLIFDDNGVICNVPILH